jgi:hypothetical protein
VGFAVQPGHAGGLVAGGQRGRLPVEGVDLGADGLVFVGDDPVGDALDERHLHLAVPGQGGDGLQPHAAAETG